MSDNRITVASWIPANEALGGRALALTIRRAILRAGNTAGWPVTVDFSGVDFITPGAADELLGVLAYRNGREDFDAHIRIENAEAIKPDVDAVVAQRLRQRAKRRAAA